MDKKDKEYQKAFPIVNNHNVFDTGMNLRDYFAAKAMQAAYTALCNKPNFSSSNELLEQLELMPKNAYWLADKMLEQRQK